jgi:hypothetical protein
MAALVRASRCGKYRRMLPVIPAKKQTPAAARFGLGVPGARGSTEAAVS